MQLLDSDGTAESAITRGHHPAEPAATDLVEVPPGPVIPCNIVKNVPRNITQTEVAQVTGHGWAQLIELVALFLINIRRVEHLVEHLDHVAVGDDRVGMNDVA